MQIQKEGNIDVKSETNPFPSLLHWSQRNPSHVPTGVQITLRQISRSGNQSLLWIVGKLQKKFKRPNNAFFFIIVKDKHIGLIRVVTDRKNSAARISPFLILPSYQGKGYAQLGLQLIEEQFPLIQTWYVDTIAEEPKLVHLYRKVGFQQLPDRETTINEHMHIIYFVKVRSW